MKLMIFAIMMSQIIIHSNAGAVENVRFSSGNEQTVMVELFTSQGCSSCPPAERWLNTFENNEKLWKDIVPIAFHVDYWDKLGWPDPYANHAYSIRQYRYQQQEHIRSVYTPGVIANGKEWRGWIRGKDFPKVNEDAGVLSFNANPESVEISFSKASIDNVLNVALLGVGITTQVRRGENRGKDLQQEFVALSHDMYSYGDINEAGAWSIPLPSNTLHQAERYAIAIWVSEMDDMAPIQSTGYWLPVEWFK